MLIVEKKNIISYSRMNISNLYKNFNPLHPRMLWFSGSWEEDKMWKVYDDDNVNNDDGQCTNFDQKSVLEPTAQLG